MEESYIFDGIKEAYPNLTTIWINGPLFMGNLQRESLKGLEHVDNLFLSDTDITKIPEGLLGKFYNLKSMK